MDIVVTGRQTTVADRFRSHAEEKLSKVASLAPKVQRIDVMVTQENRRQVKAAERVEITCHGKGPVIRAEASADDKYGALDVAMDKLIERLRRRNDRRRVSRGGHRTPESVAQATARFDAAHLEEELSGGAAETDEQDRSDRFGDSPVQIREKVHASAPMTLEDALLEMELVGHDFFLFHDSETDRPSVLYRRRGWSYGVIHLDVVEPTGDSGGDTAVGSQTDDRVGASVP